MPLPQAQLTVIAAVLALAFIADIAAAQLRGRPSPAVRQVIDQLTAEAEEVAAEQRLRSDQPDFADRAGDEIDLDEIGSLLIRRVHRDPFIDAYVRWQLTGFQPPLPEMDRRSLRALLREAPAMVENPRAAPQVVDLMQRAAEAGPLSESDGAQLRDVVDDLDRRSAEAERMNRPAEGFRDWVYERLAEEHPAGSLHWLLENCEATIRAGWPTQRIKTRITSTFADVGPMLTDAERRALAGHLDGLAHMERRFVNTISFMADGSVRVRFSTGAVRPRDVERWIERLAGSDEP